MKELRALALDVSVIAGNKEIALNGFEDSTFEYPRNKLETERREVDLKNLLDAAPQEIALDSSIFDTPEEDDSDLFANTDDNNEFDIQLPEFVSLDDEDDLPSLEDFGDELSEVLGTLENPSDEDDNY